MYATEYFINAYEDIEDQAGNIILSRKDRYHVSDSAGVGFSEVHGVEDNSVTDKSWLTARSYAYQTDRDYWQSKAITDYNDFEHPDRVVPAEFKGAKLSKQTVTVKVPAKSIAVIRIK